MRRSIAFLFAFVSFSVTTFYALRSIGALENLGRVETGILMMSFFLVAIVMSYWYHANAKGIEDTHERTEQLFRRIFALLRRR